MELREIEAFMRPGKLSAGGFLGHGESLMEVLEGDNKTIKRLGITHEQIADRIEYFVKFVNSKIEERGKVIDGKYFLKVEAAYLGGQTCPWRDIINDIPMPWSSVDLYVVNQKTGEKIGFPDAIVHLIREHHFYEGKKSPYRVDPERAIRVLDIK